MTCPRCGAQNRDGARFCRACGVTFAPACPRCGAELDAGGTFCDRCGAPLPGQSTPPPPRFGSPQSYTPKHLAEKILTSRGALEGERKQVTVLFADVSGFTSLSERLDPEDVHALITRAFELMLGEVHRYEGTVNQFLGDGIMALFGAPLAHEDHAQRAVRAALGIRETLAAWGGELERERGIAFQVRQGLNTGLVVVGSIGSDLRLDYTAVGDTTNVAARMLQAAGPGGLVIAEATWRLVRDHVETRALGELTLKGKDKAVAAWEVHAARPALTRVEAAAERGLTPFVGRDRELRVLAECFSQAEAGRGQVVFVVGEPGIGKSRLLHEFRRSLGAGAAWLEGRCVSFGRAMALHPLIDLLKRACGIDDGDDEPAIAGKVESSVRAAGGDPATTPLVKYLLSVDPGDPAVSAMDAQYRRAEIFDVLRRLTVQAALRRPHVILFEDLHWVDQATEEYLARLDELVPTSRVLLIGTYRPGYRLPLPEHTYHRRLVLDSLSSHDTAALAEGMLLSDSVPGPLRALIARKADGNPFFVEEVVRSLCESGALRHGDGGWTLAGPLEQVVVPDTIHDVIMSRIDRLPEPAKRVLQVAAVIGREFPGRLLDRVIEPVDRACDPISPLKATELIYERAGLPEVAYTFKHALTQEVAYASLLLQRRRVLHQRIASAIEEIHGDRLAEHYEVLALHFRRADAPRKALEYLLKAADKAARRFAAREALALYEEAGQVAGSPAAAAGPETHIALHRAKCDLYVLVSDFERARLEGEQALAAARSAGATLAEGEVLVVMSMASALSHRFDRSLEEARDAVAVGRRVGAPHVVAGAELTTVFVYELTGRLEEAQATVDRVFMITRATGDAVNEASALVFGAELKHWEDRYEDASRMYAAGIEMARQHNVMVALLEGGFMWGVNLTGHGRYDEALAVFEDGLALAEKVGDENYTPRYLNSLGRLHLECGDLDRAQELNRRAAAEARRRRDDESIANADLNLADIAWASGDTMAAAAILEGVHRRVKDPATSEWMRWRYSMHLFASLSEVTLGRGDLAGADAAARQCLRLATRTRSRKYVVRAHRLLGGIALARRRYDDAEQALREALAMARTIGSPATLWPTHAALGRLHAARGRPDAAREADVAAREVVDGLMGGVRHPALRATLGGPLAPWRLADPGGPR